MREIFKQFIIIWQQIKLLQKIFLLATLLFVTGALGYLIFKSSASTYVAIYPKQHMDPIEIAQLRTLLETSSISYKEDEEKGLLVSKQEVEKVREVLTKKETVKGFELFDSNTWIKGDKELQVMEMRALKGQLEKDLAGFDPIKSASVILDIPPQRSFNQAGQHKAKASVILTLMPDAHLSISQIKAITNHLAGAVRGLETERISLSDTKGKLYKALDADEVLFPYEQMALAEELREQVDDLLTKIVGKTHFHTNMTSMSIAIDSHLIHEEKAQVAIEEQLQRLAGDKEFLVSFLPFHKEKKGMKKGVVKKQYFFAVGGVVVLVAALVVFYLLFPHFKKKHEEEDDDFIFRFLTRVDLPLLTAAIEGEEPATIALMLSYLEPKKAEEMIATFPEKTQDEILFHLSEIEREEL